MGSTIQMGWRSAAADPTRGVPADARTVPGYSGRLQIRTSGAVGDTISLSDGCIRLLPASGRRVAR